MPELEIADPRPPDYTGFDKGTNRYYLRGCLLTRARCWEIAELQAQGCPYNLQELDVVRNACDQYLSVWNDKRSKVARLRDSIWSREMGEMIRKLSESLKEDHERK